LRDFYLAFQAWREVHVLQPWEIGRMIGFWSVAPHSKTLRRFEDLMPLEIDAIRNRASKRKIEKAIIRPITEEEKEILKRVTNGRLE
jgi:hypothetical protein